MKKFLLGLSTVLISGMSYSYTLIGEGHVYDPVIVKIDPSFRFIEDSSSYEMQKKNLSGAVAASVNNVSGKQGQHIEVDGFHDVYIFNDTSKVQLYKYTYELYIENEQVGLMIRNVDLSPGSAFYASDITAGDLQKKPAGSYKLIAKTTTQGTNTNFHAEGNATGTVKK